MSQLLARHLSTISAVLRYVNKEVNLLHIIINTGMSIVPKDTPLLQVPVHAFHWCQPKMIAGSCTFIVGHPCHSRVSDTAKVHNPYSIRYPS